MPTGVSARQPRELPDPLERFWRFVDRDSVEGCWPWTGGLRKGYGRFWADQKSVLAHRYIYAREHGPLQPGEQVLHRCDNPVCVRPSHLFVGSQQVNIRDCHAKGRNAFNARPIPGEANGNAKLTEGQVRAIREQIREGVSQRRIAALYRVSKYAVYSIAKGLTWGHLSDSVIVDR